jgi:hypothetical protein
MAPHCVSTRLPTRRSTPNVQPETRKCLAGFGMPQDEAEQRRRTTTRRACSQIHEEPKNADGIRPRFPPSVPDGPRRRVPRRPGAAPSADMRKQGLTRDL